MTLLLAITRDAAAAAAQLSPHVHVHHISPSPSSIHPSILGSVVAAKCHHIKRHAHKCDTQFNYGYHQLSLLLPPSPFTISAR